MNLIEELEAIKVHGSVQWLLERGADASNPILLYVHGGPGSTLMPFARAFDGDLIQEFLVVHWDQRGAGKSFDPAADPRSFHLRQFVEDGLAVVGHLQRKFGSRKIYIAGHSWGTIVASQMVQREPGLFPAYIGISQVVRPERADELKIDFVRQRATDRNDLESLKTLEEIGQPPFASAHAILALSQLVMKYGGTFHQMEMKDLERALETNREYAESDLKRQEEGMLFSLKHLGQEIAAYNAFREVPEIKVPVLLIQGRHDMATPASLAFSYYEALEAPQGKEWIKFRSSAHFPMWEQPDEFLRQMRILKAQTCEL